MSVIRLTKISRRYEMGSETIHALREVSLNINGVNTSRSWGPQAQANPL